MIEWAGPGGRQPTGLGKIIRMNKLISIIAAAKDGGNKGAERSFNFANEVEKVHHALYEKALKSLEEKLKALDMYICPVCGAKGKTFKKID